jgi:hypothetical protein
VIWWRRALLALVRFNVVNNSSSVSPQDRISFCCVMLPVLQTKHGAETRTPSVVALQPVVCDLEEQHGNSGSRGR